MRRTTGGWAHVKASDYASLGYGYGYAYAQDQLCELADIMVTVNGQRSRYFGPEDGNLESDFFYQRIKDMRTVQRLARRRAPHGPSQVVRDTINGFAAGYNAYLRRTGRAAARSHLPRQALGAPDHSARHVPAHLPARPARQLGQLPQRDRGGRAAERHRRGRARGPAGRSSAARLRPAGLQRRLGIGRDGANGERALLLSNPHFPWKGPERWYEVHLTIPGKLNVIGAALQGVPVVNIGFNRNVAWITPSRPRAASRPTS